MINAEKCPEQFDVNKALKSAFVLNNKGLVEFKFTTSATSNVQLDVKKFVMELATCINNKNKPCVLNKVLDPFAFFSKSQQKNNEKAFKTIQAQTNRLLLILRDLFVINQNEKEPMFQNININNLKVKSQFQGKDVALLEVDNGGLPILRTRTMIVTANQALQLQKLPNSPGRIRMTISKMVLQKTPKGLQLVTWE